jgi:hypothetical protein
MSNTKSADFERQARHKERGLWNFLTWSFFLSQVLAEGQYTGAAMASTVNTEEASEQSDQKTPSSGQPPMGPALGSGFAGDESQPTDASFAAAAAPQVALADVSAQSLSAFADIEVADDTASRQSALMGASAGGHVALAEGNDTAPAPANDPDTSSDPSTGGGCGIDVPSVLPPIGSGVVDLIDDLLDPPLSAIDDLAGVLTDSLTGTVDDVLATLEHSIAQVSKSVAQVPEVLEAVLSKTVPEITALTGEAVKQISKTLTTTVETATDGLSDLLDLDKPGGSGLVPDLVSAPGQIVFKVLAIGGDRSDDLFSRHGEYTDYNLAVRAEKGHDTEVNASVASTSSTTLLDHLLVPAPSHGDNTAQLAPAHVIDEIALRGDGLGL